MELEPSLEVLLHKARRAGQEARERTAALRASKEEARWSDDPENPWYNTTDEDWLIEQGDAEGRAWNRLKDPVAAVVGFFGKYKSHPVLGTRGAYEVVYGRLHNALVGAEPTGD